MTIFDTIPANACEECFLAVCDQAKLVVGRDWTAEGGPQGGTGPVHWARRVSDKASGAFGTLHTIAMEAVCGKRYTFEVDSGD
jgi:hypothetical protein